MNNYSAGVLLYSYDPGGCVTFLLGRDYRNKYSDFGGRCDQHDEYHIDTAAREFYEETCGTIYDEDIVRHKIKDSHIVHSLSYMGNPYYMYLVYVPYSNEMCTRFHDIRRFLNNNITIDKRFKEKLDIRWFTIDDIFNKKEAMRQVFFRTINRNIGVIRHLTSRKVLKH
jgi:hypothetical protein